jgi:hypothetical protein
VYATDAGIEELLERRGEETVSVEWLADRLRTFVDLNPAFEDAVERVATFSPVMTAGQTTGRRVGPAQRPARAERPAAGARTQRRPLDGGRSGPRRRPGRASSGVGVGLRRMPQRQPVLLPEGVEHAVPRHRHREPGQCGE